MTLIITDCPKFKFSVLLCLREVFLHFDKLFFVVERHHSNVVFFCEIDVADRLHRLGENYLLGTYAHGENLIEKADKLWSLIACRLNLTFSISPRLAQS